jgi:hypothetical protein
VIKSLSLSLRKLGLLPLVSLIAITCAWSYLYWVNILETGVIIDFADGVAHYDLSRGALENPKNFFDNWARPAHVLFSVLPAQFGIEGFVLSHILLMVVNSLLIIHLGARWNLSAPWLLPWWMIANTAVIHVTLGGLTEPLFISLSLLSLVLLDAKRWFGLGIALGATLIARHEALLVIAVVLFYASFSEGYNAIRRGAIGFFILLTAVSILGIVWGGKSTLFWIVSDQPYGRNPNVYGAGTWTHFWDNRRFWASKVMIGAFAISLGVALFELITTKKLNVKLIPFAIALGTLTAHSILWKFGWMGSLGLTRILSIAVPFMALGVHTLNWKGGLFVVPLFLGHVYQWNRDSPDTKYEKSVQQIVSESDLDGLRSIPQSIRIAAQWKLPLILKGFPTNNSKRMVQLWDLPPLLPSSAMREGDLIIWDNVTGFREGGIDLAICRRDAGLQLIDSVEHYGVKLVVFRVVQSDNEELLVTSKLVKSLSGYGVWSSNNAGELIIRSPKKYGRIMQLRQNSTTRVTWKGSPNGELVIRSHDGNERLVGSEGSLIFKKIDNPTMLLWRAENGEALMHFEAIKTQDQKLVASNEQLATSN